MSQRDTKDNENVIPAQAGIQSDSLILDSCLRRNDDLFDFLRVHQLLIYKLYRKERNG